MTFSGGQFRPRSRSRTLRRGRGEVPPADGRQLPPGGFPYVHTLAREGRRGPDAYAADEMPA
ncbi:hypothetical protein ACRJ4W_21945 [Streptomyces sp. GLT-R25]